MPNSLGAAPVGDRLRCYGLLYIDRAHTANVNLRSALRSLANPVLSLAEDERKYAPRA